MRQFTVDQLLIAFKSKGYELKDKPYEMNIFGVRNEDAESNKFDDVVGLLYRDERGMWRLKQYKATTDPGVYYRTSPMNVNGTAIMIPMQHKKCYKIGTHKGYKAIQQIAPMSYVRDNNKNKVLDFLYKVAGFKKVNEIAATNIHHASPTGESTNVDNWSAGCQVIANIIDFNEFINIIQISVTNYKHTDLFDYTLFELKDIN